MDNGVVQTAQIESITSISSSIERHDLNNGSTSQKSENEFVNHGLLLWNQTRQQWLGDRKRTNRPQDEEPRISWNASYESLLGTNKRFAQPIPLPEMIDFLIDVWDQEGMYD